MDNQRILSAIDIGSNTILMLIAKDLGNKQYEIVKDVHAIARLGEGLAQTGIINNQSILRAEKILEEYKRICENFGVIQIKSVATSAIRESKNGLEVSQRLSSVLGSNIEIISGNEEAYLSFIGTVDTDDLCTVVDIGGGSTEFISGEKGKLNYKKSIKTGAVKITEKFFPTHPPNSNQLEKAEKEIKKNLNEIDKSVLQGYLYAVAGTPTTLASIAKGIKEYDYAQIDGTILTLDFLDDILKEFIKLSIVDIIDKYNIHPKRADVITAGTIILKCILELLGRTNFIVSAKGLRFGVLKKILQ